MTPTQDLQTRNASISNDGFVLLWDLNVKFYHVVSAAWEILIEHLHPQFSHLRRRTIFLISGGVRTLVDLAQVNKEGAPYVDLALRFETLAICAVFAFVGAILLGMF